MPSLDTQPANAFEHLVVLIPAWQPDARLLALVEELSGCGFGGLLVVDDGSGRASSAIFAGLNAHSCVRILRHPRNRGKGRALKTGFDFVQQQMPESSGVITADADGQHTAADIVRVAGALPGAGASLVLGARTFTGREPMRSRLGNAITRSLFRLLTGVGLSDTQSGLRGIPRALLQELSQLRGEHYEYEIVVLAHLCKTRRRPLEVPIQTIYVDGNRSSHFRPVSDSLRVLAALIRCSLERR